jgi:NAD(P)-dependent dehydrogenase (short-subunit alcohol dehydrogenase family)
MPGWNLENCTAIVTGASRGIGKALALTLARAKALVGLVARDEEALQHVARQIADYGWQSITISADVARPEMAESIARQAQTKMGRIDILINAAGIQAPIGTFMDNDLLEWEHTIQVNLLGPVRLIHALLPMMIANRGGKIINFSGGGATAPRPNFSAYATSKAALVRFTETLAEELKPHNIQVNAVAPGAVNTQMLDEVLAAGEKAGIDYRQALERAKAGGTPVELVCDLVLFLASAASGCLTGKLISAPHDPWRSWVGKAEELNATPLYTIRRLDPFTIKPISQKLT